MPIYEYRCDNGHTFEVMQRMSDDPLTECTVCGAPVQRVFHPVAVHFKGSGFYTTDYGQEAPGRRQRQRLVVVRRRIVQEGRLEEEDRDQVLVLFVDLVGPAARTARRLLPE